MLVQDVERRSDGPAVKQGVAKDRLLSVHDPEMRHGRKSASKRFDGHKAAVAVDTAEPLIVAVDVLTGNAPDAAGALELIAQAEVTTGCVVDERMGTAPTAAARPARRLPRPAEPSWRKCRPRSSGPVCRPGF